MILEHHRRNATKLGHWAAIAGAEDGDRVKGRCRTATSGCVLSGLNTSVLKLNPTLVGTVLSCWDFVWAFSKLIKLECFSIDEFVAALTCENGSSVLMTEVHICLLKVLFQDDDTLWNDAVRASRRSRSPALSSIPFDVEPDSIMTPLNWQAVLHIVIPQLEPFLQAKYNLKRTMIVDKMYHEGRLLHWKTVRSRLGSMEYYVIPVQYKVSLLQLLVEAAYSTNVVRVEAFQNAEDTHRLLMTRQEKLWELSRRRKADDAAKRQDAIQEIYRRRRRADREAALNRKGKNNTRPYKKSKNKQPGHVEIQKVREELSARKACGGCEFIVMDPHELHSDKSDFAKVELRTAAEQELTRLSRKDCSAACIDKLTSALKHARDVGMEGETTNGVKWMCPQMQTAYIALQRLKKLNEPILLSRKYDTLLGKKVVRTSPLGHSIHPQYTRIYWAFKGDEGRLHIEEIPKRKSRGVRGPHSDSRWGYCNTPEAVNSVIESLRDQDANEILPRNIPIVQTLSSWRDKLVKGDYDVVDYRMYHNSHRAESTSEDDLGLPAMQQILLQTEESIHSLISVRNMLERIKPQTRETISRTNWIKEAQSANDLSRLRNCLVHFEAMIHGLQTEPDLSTDVEKDPEKDGDVSDDDRGSDERESINSYSSRDAQNKGIRTVLWISWEERQEWIHFVKQASSISWVAMGFLLLMENCTAKEHRAAQCAEIELLQSQTAIIKPTVGPIQAANEVLTSLCKELESRSDSIAKEIKIVVDKEQRLRRELSEECQIEIVKLSKQVQEADLKRRKGIEEHASVHMKLKELLVEYQKEYKRQATELDSFHEQISMLKQKNNGMVKEEEDLNISSLECNKMMEELEKNRMELRSRLNAGSTLYNIDKATTIHVKLKTKQLDRSTLMRKVIKLKEEHNSLQKAIASNTAAIARMRKEQAEMEGDEELALSKKEVITLNARNLVSARQSFIERTNLLKGLLPTGDHDDS